jgi:hypothetical protein
VQAGLFSGVVTAFLIESYKALSEDTNGATVALLTQISAQLADMTNSSQLSNGQPVAPPRSAFSPSTSSLVINAMWFLSLSLSLACALAATLVQHWARNYARSVERFQQSPHKQGLLRALMFEGLEKSHLSEIVEHIPTLIHAALFLFLAGLVTFLHRISLPIAYLVLSILVTCSILYGVATLFPLLHPESPLHTPLSSTLWYAVRYTFRVDTRPMDSISDMQISLATREDELEQPHVRNRVTSAIQWTYGLANEPHEVEEFMIAIPGFSLWQLPLLMNLIAVNPFLQLSAHHLLRILVAPTGYWTAAQSSRHAQCLEAIYIIITHSSDLRSLDFLSDLAKYLPFCDSNNLSLAFCAIFAFIDNFSARNPREIWKTNEDGQFYGNPPTPRHPAKILPVDIGGIRHSIVGMLEFTLGAHRQAVQNHVDSMPQDQMFHPFEFIIRKTLPDQHPFFGSDPKPGWHILFEAIWKAAEENIGQGPFQQTAFVNFLNNFLSANLYVTYNLGFPLPVSMQTVLSALLKATASLDDTSAINKAVSLLSKCSQANPDQFYDVQEAKTSLRRLREKLPPGYAEHGNSHLPFNNEHGRPIDPSGFLRWYIRPGPQLPGRRQVFFDFHTDWFETYTFPNLNA